MIALFAAAALLQPDAGDRERLDPSAFGVQVSFPDGWERDLVESLQFRLVHKPKDLSGTDEEGRALYARLILSRLGDRAEPRGDPGWNLVREDAVASFLSAHPGGARLAGEASRVSVGGQRGVRMRLDLREADGTPRTAVATVFFHSGGVWRLDLIASPGVFDRLGPDYEAVLSGIGFADSPWYVWVAAGAAASIAAVALLSLLMRKRS